MTFGENIKEARKSAGYSQEQLAKVLAVSRSAIAKWEADKGLPDINNLKAISQVLNVSIDYLLDDGTKLDLSIVRKAVNLSEYTDKKINIMNKKQIKDKVVRTEYPEAEICTLIAEEKLTKGEKVVDAAIFLFTPLCGMVKLSKQFNNLDNEFYLVTQGNKQNLVVVTEEYIESRALAEKITDKKFAVGNYTFQNCGPIVFT